MIIKNYIKDNNPYFYSNEICITKKYLIQHQLKLTYQRHSISNLDLKHKEWSKFEGH